MNVPQDPPGFDVIQYGTGLQEFALRGTLAFGNERTRRGLESLLGKLKAAPGALQQHPACAMCSSFGIPRALVSELVPITGVIQNLSGEQVAGLRQRSELYAGQTRPHRNGTLAESSASCPFLIEGKCILGSSKPFNGYISPEGQPTLEEIAARSLEFGHTAGLRLLGLDHHRVELGMVLPALIDEPSWPDRYLAGEPCFREQALFEPGPDPTIEYAKALAQKREANGFPEQGQPASAARTGRPFLGSIQLPFAYESDEDIDRWRAVFSKNLRELASSRWDAVEAFNSLRRHNAFSFAYHDRDSRDLFRDHAKLLIEPIVAKAFPELVRPVEPRRPSGRLRVGYLSENLRGHNGGAWAIHWIANHGPEIESFVFATSANQTNLSIEFFSRADHYYHMPSDVAYSARFIKSLDLDVLIFTDLGQHGANYQFAAMRLAPIQCTAWGSPITSGLSTIDYYLSSKLMEPPKGDEHYTEKLVRLPGTGQYFERMVPKPHAGTRKEFGLPKGFVALMPQYLPKMAPGWDPLFARISQELENPLLFFEVGDPRTIEVSRKRFERSGIRIQWLPWMERDEFHRVLQLVDLVLDPPSYSGGITTTEILSLGKPIVTLPGESMRSRFGLAFLTQARMTSLVARDPDHYVELVKDRQAQATAVENADFDGPFRDVAATDGLNKWLLTIVGQALSVPTHRLQIVPDT